MRRMACLIGNDSYEQWSPLSCAVNDAERMERVLQKHGFETIVHKNLNMEDLRSAVSQFRYSLANCDAGLLFFAGHGVEVEGRQYLVPVNAPSYENIDDCDKDIYDTTGLIKLFSECTAKEENFVGIIVFDCCRSRLTKFCANRGPSAVSLLQAKGVYISFATEPGNKAKEIGKHGLFTLSLCDAIEQHGAEKIEDVFKRVRKDVVTQCNEQIPWDHSSLLGDFYFQDTTALLKKSAAWGKDWLNPDFLQDILGGALSYTEIKDRVYCQADEINASLSQKEELLIKVLDQLDNLYIKEHNLTTRRDKQHDD